MDYLDAGITDDTIAEVIYKTFDYILYTEGWEEYDGENNMYYLYDGVSVYDIMYDVIQTLYELTDDEMAMYFSLIEGVEEWAAATFETLTFDENGDWSITNREEIHTALYTMYDEAGVNVEEVGIDDELIDTVLNATIEIIIYGEQSEWTSEHWMDVMTDMIYDLTLTTDEMTELIYAEIADMTTWMETYPEDYALWLEENYAQKDIFVMYYEEDTEPVFCSYFTNGASTEDCAEDLPEVWQAFLSVSFESEIDLSNKDQKQIDNFNDLEEELEADDDYDRWSAIFHALNEVYAARVDAQMEDTSNDITYTEIPADVYVCDEPRVAEGENWYNSYMDYA